MSLWWRSAEVGLGEQIVVVLVKTLTVPLTSVGFELKFLSKSSNFVAFLESRRGESLIQRAICSFLPAVHLTRCPRAASGIAKAVGGFSSVHVLGTVSAWVPL